MKYNIITLGCKVNQYESSILKSALDSIGFVYSEKKPDIIIVNTCSVTESAIRKDRRIVNKIKKDNPKAKLYVMGCLVRVDENASEYLKADKASRSVEALEILNDFGLGDLVSDNNLEQYGTFDRSRYFIKIQDGCEQFCSYCIIPFVRGKMQSRKEMDIISEIEKAVNRGYGEIVLSGIHIGLYGKEHGNEEKTSLAKLLKKIIEIKKDFRIRISSIEITEVNNELIAMMAESDKLCKHLHISLQSGSDNILRAMNRPYDRAYFKKRIEKIRKEIPNIAISTDIIVGFPGETEKEFENTCQFAKEIEFSKIHVFSFSAHKKTKAYNLAGHLEKSEKQKRSSVLRGISSELEKKYKKKFHGQELGIVVEKFDDKYIYGKSEFHFDVKINKNTINKGDLKSGKLLNIQN